MSEEQAQSWVADDPRKDNAETGSDVSIMERSLIGGFLTTGLRGVAGGTPQSLCTPSMVCLAIRSTGLVFEGMIAIVGHRTSHQKKTIFDHITRFPFFLFPSISAQPLKMVAGSQSLLIYRRRTTSLHRWHMIPLQHCPVPFARRHMLLARHCTSHASHEYSTRNIIRSEKSPENRHL